MNQNEAQELTSLLNKWAKKSNDEEQLTHEPEFLFYLKKIALLLEHRSNMIEMKQNAAGESYIGSFPHDGSPKGWESFIKAVQLNDELNENRRKNKAVKA